MCWRQLFAPRIAHFSNTYKKSTLSLLCIKGQLINWDKRGEELEYLLDVPWKVLVSSSRVRFLYHACFYIFSVSQYLSILFPWRDFHFSTACPSFPCVYWLIQEWFVNLLIYVLILLVNQHQQSVTENTQKIWLEFQATPVGSNI